MEQRKFIVIHQGADNVKLGNDLETLDLLMDTKDSLEPCAKEICEEIEDFIMNNDEDVTITGFKHGVSTPHVGPQTTAFSNQTTALPWEKILEFTVTEKEEREEKEEFTVTEGEASEEEFTGTEAEASGEEKPVFKDDREDKMAVLKEKLTSGEITHVYAKVGEYTPIVFAIFQLGA